MLTVLTAKEIAKALRVSESTISRLAKQNKIPGGHRVGGQWRFTEEVIDRWLSGETPPKNRAEPPPRRRKRFATQVQRDCHGRKIEFTQAVEMKNEKTNGQAEAHGIQHPVAASFDGSGAGIE